MKFSISRASKWSVLIGLITLVMACFFSVTSIILLEDLSWGLGMLVVLVLILIGIVFDIIGIASTSAREEPFHAMASEKVKGSKQAVAIIRNADRFSSFCNDVIGDICGVISGAASTLVIIKLLASFGAGDAMLLRTVVTVLFTGIVSALTVGGKAFGKSMAMAYSTNTILGVGKVLYFLEHRMHIRIIKTNNKAGNGKRGSKRAARAD